MKGLDASIVSLSDIPDLNPANRIDAEFFGKRALASLSKIREGEHTSIGLSCKRIQHPIEVKREYDETGLLTIMAKDVRSNKVELSNPSFMPQELLPTVRRNRLAEGDILVTRTGANFGQTAPWKQSTEAFACADILIIREPTIASGYLTSFMESEIGKPLLLRAGYGAGQPHISPPYLANVLLPRFEKLESEVDRAVESSARLEEAARSIIRTAEHCLKQSLGIVGWDDAQPLTYSAPSKFAALAGRLDSQFFAPRIQALLDVLSVDGRSLSDVAVPRRQRFKPDRQEEFDYIEIGDMDGAGGVSSTRMATLDAPSRATWHVRPDDIITSTVRPIRRLSAQIRPDQDGFVCSSGFVVISPYDIPPEVLLTYLRLPVICELLDLYASASMYPAITEADIFNLPLPYLPDEVTEEIVEQVKSARAAKERAALLLNASKRAVEIAIEENETTALEWLETTAEEI